MQTSLSTYKQLELEFIKTSKEAKIFKLSRVRASNKACLAIKPENEPCMESSFTLVKPCVFFFLSFTSCRLICISFYITQLSLSRALCHRVIPKLSCDSFDYF